LTPLVSPAFARGLVLDELADLTLYQRLRPIAGPDLRRVLDELIPVETRHFRFWKDFFKSDADRLDLGRRFKVFLLTSLCRVFGDGAIQLVLEGIEIHGIRKYLAVWEKAKDTPLGEAVREVLEDEMRHEDAIVLQGKSERMNPEKVRSIFLGFNDGCVEILGAVSGFMASFETVSHVLMAATSVAAAGAVSMAAGAYVAMSSEREVERLEEGKRRFLSSSSDGEGRPSSLLQASALVGISYIVGATVPVLPVMLGAHSLWMSVMAAAAAGVLVSLILSFLTGMELKRRILLNLLIIAAAAAVSHGIGIVAKRFWGVDL
jgi:vacuolar iron transporter family protein